ncbi:unnamed protein product, partial [Polarella glacialis]
SLIRNMLRPSRAVTAPASLKPTTGNESPASAPLNNNSNNNKNNNNNSNNNNNNNNNKNNNNNNNNDNNNGSGNESPVSPSLIVIPSPASSSNQAPGKSARLIGVAPR